MQREEVRSFFERRPFAPFRLRMISGTTADIRTPESLVGPRHIAFLNRHGVIEVIATEFIESIEPLIARRRNGRKRPGSGR